MAPFDNSECESANGQIKPLATFCGSNNPDSVAPLTGFDWNVHDKKKLGTASIDTTCTIWNSERGKIETQLIAHDKAVYDMQF